MPRSYFLLSTFLFVATTTAFVPQHVPSQRASSLHATIDHETFTSAIAGVSESMIQEGRSMWPEIVDEMPPPIPEVLKNKYYFLRHGQSTANVASVISSDRSLAYSDQHGLTLTGYEQGKASANALLEQLEAVQDEISESG